MIVVAFGCAAVRAQVAKKSVGETKTLATTRQRPVAAKKSEPKTLTITWQRMVGDKGNTCERCAVTQAELHKAHANLRKSLSPLGINVVLVEEELAALPENVADSNLVRIGNKRLEAWLGATISTSDCAGCKSMSGQKAQCRTIKIGNQTYESIPSELIVKAGQLAAAEILGVETVPKGGDQRGQGVRAQVAKKSVGETKTLATTQQRPVAATKSEPKTLTIIWQHAYAGDAKAEVANTTEMNKVCGNLRESLSRLGINVVLVEESLSALNTSSPNARVIRIADKPLTTWLGPTVESSPSELSELIVKAGLLAAAETIKIKPGKSVAPCCPKG